MVNKNYVNAWRGCWCWKLRKEMKTWAWDCRMATFSRKDVKGMFALKMLRKANNTLSFNSLAHYLRFVTHSWTPEDDESARWDIFLMCFQKKLRCFEKQSITYYLKISLQRSTRYKCCFSIPSLALLQHKARFNVKAFN